MEFTSSVYSSLIAAVLVLAGFLPLMAFNYYRYRRHQRLGDIERILEKVPIDDKCEEIFCREDRPSQFIVPVVFAWLVSLLGLALTVAVLGNYLFGLKVSWLSAVNKEHGEALMMVCMAFLGAYLWAVQDIFSRYSISYLRPSAFYSLSLRMVLACAVAVLFYYAMDAINASGEGLQGGLLPALAFLIGSFPQRGLEWLQQRLPFFRQSSDPTVEQLPLSMIEGTTAHDGLRFRELGIDNCYDLAAADFIPLLFKTPYSARQLIDWLLQAKLCVFVGAEIRELRQRGLRTIIDVGRLEDDDVERLVAETRLTDLCLRRVRDLVEDDRKSYGDIDRLCRVAHIVSTYWLTDDDAESSTGSEPASSGEELEPELANPSRFETRRAG